MMDLFPADTNTAACSHPFAHVVAGRVFEGPFEVVCDQFVAQALQDPYSECHYLARSPNVTVEVSDPMVRSLELMEDLNL
jgi:hypothetical protein